MSVKRLIQPEPADSSALLSELESLEGEEIPEHKLQAERVLGYRPRANKEVRIKRDTRKLIALLAEYQIPFYKAEDVQRFRRDRTNLFLGSKRKLRNGLFRQLALLIVITYALFVPDWTVERGTPLAVFMVVSMTSMFLLIPLAIGRIVFVSILIRVNTPTWYAGKVSSYKGEIPDDILESAVMLAQANPDLKFRVYELSSALEVLDRFLCVRLGKANFYFAQRW